MANTGLDFAANVTNRLIGRSGRSGGSSFPILDKIQQIHDFADKSNRRASFQQAVNDFTNSDEYKESKKLQKFFPLWKEDTRQFTELQTSMAVRNRLKKRMAKMNINDSMRKNIEFSLEDPDGLKVAFNNMATYANRELNSKLKTRELQDAAKIKEEEKLKKQQEEKKREMRTNLNMLQILKGSTKDEAVLQRISSLEAGVLKGVPLGDLMQTSKFVGSGVSGASRGGVSTLGGEKVSELDKATWQRQMDNPEIRELIGNGDEKGAAKLSTLKENQFSRLYSLFRKDTAKEHQRQETRAINRQNIIEGLNIPRALQKRINTKKDPLIGGRVGSVAMSLSDDEHTALVPIANSGDQEVIQTYGTGVDKAGDPIDLNLIFSYVPTKGFAVRFLQDNGAVSADPIYINSEDGKILLAQLAGRRNDEDLVKEAKELKKALEITRQYVKNKGKMVETKVRIKALKDVVYNIDALEKASRLENKLESFTFLQGKIKEGTLSEQSSAMVKMLGETVKGVATSILPDRIELMIGDTLNDITLEAKQKMMLEFMRSRQILGENYKGN